VSRGRNERSVNLARHPQSLSGSFVPAAGLIKVKAEVTRDCRAWLKSESASLPQRENIATVRGRLFARASG